MAAQLAIDLAADADARLALQKLQIIVDGAVAPQIDLRAIDNAGTLEVDFPDEIAEEQVLACFNALVNTAGLRDSGLDPDSIALTGDVSAGSRQRTYSV